MSKNQAVALTLKNIYRLLTKDDYPSYSPPVIPRRQRRGISLASFWQEVLAPGVAITQEGQDLWASGDKRHRYLSDLFNRSRGGGFYNEYFEQVGDALNPEVFLGTIQRMALFLSRSNYVPAALSIRLAQFLALIQAQDTDIIPAVHSHLAELLWLEPEFSADAGRRLYFDAYLLSMMALHAFFGFQMNNGPMSRLRLNPAARIQALFVVYQNRNKGAAFPQPAQLTRRQSILCQQPMEPQLFVGRQKIQEDLRQRILAGGKILVSGLGGIGKTELLRQTLQPLLGEGVFARIAYVQYEGSLKESFSQAFFDLPPEGLDSRFELCISRLNDPSAGRTLLVIDNINVPEHKDAGISALSTLNCDVVVTSRLLALNSFHKVGVDAPDAPSARQIFLNSYGKPVSPEEEPALQRLLQENLGYHTLLCGLAGKMARAKHLSIAVLGKSLQEEGLKGRFIHQGEQVDLAQIARFLFRSNRLSEDEQKLLRLFALFPYRVYAFSVCVRLLADISPSADALADMLQLLSYQGWLQEDGIGYAMHPLVAEAMLETPVAMQDYPRFWALIAENLRPERFFDWHVVDIACHALLRSETCSEEAGMLLLHTIFMLNERFDSSARVALLLEKASALMMGPASPTPSFEYGFLLASLSNDRLTGRTETAAEKIGRLLSLETSQRGGELHINGLQAVLDLSANLGLENERKSVHSILLSLQLSGLQEVKRCLTLSMHYGIRLKNYQEAITWGERGLALAQDLGLEGIFYLGKLHMMMLSAYAGLGDIPKAEQHKDSYLLAVRAWSGEVYAFAKLDALFVMALAYYYAAQYEKALVDYLECLSIRKAINPADSFAMDALLGNIANTYLALKDYDKALEYSLQSSQMLQRLAPEPSLRTVMMNNSLGCIYRERGDAAQAEALLQEARDLGAQLLGKEELYYAEPSFNLGKHYQNLGEMQKAVDCYQSALPVFQARYGKEHPRTLLLERELETALKQTKPGL